jgi:hypothetical protein
MIDTVNAFDASILARRVAVRAARSARRQGERAMANRPPERPALQPECAGVARAGSLSMRHGAPNF